MGLIINDKLQMLMVGYPTVSDKYNVTGGVLVGDVPVKFGSLVKHSDQKGFYEAITGAVTIDKIAGFVLATNVKMPSEWPGNTVVVQPGEAFNLVLRDSFLAVELDEDAVEENILANKAVAVKLASGKLSTTGVAGATDLPDVVFTGVYEKHGTTIVAEIYIK